MNSRVKRAVGLASKDNFFHTTVFGAAPQTERLVPQSKIEPSEVHKLDVSQEAILNDYE